MEQMYLKAYGKINLALDVLRKREDGYHDVRMVMQTVGIFDGIEITKTDTGRIEIETNLFYLPTDENNIVYKAAKMLFDEFNIKDGMKIVLKKFIPVSAGMAGGSTDAATVMFGINKMFNLKLTLQQLMDRGVKIGADVPYCLMRGTALSEGIGEKLTKLPDMIKCPVLIAKPPISVSTKFVYENLKLDEVKEHPDIDGMIEALKHKDLDGVAARLGNVLETVTAKEYPVRDSMRMMRLLYRLGLGEQEKKHEQLTSFSKSVSSLQAKAREIKYKGRLDAMERRTMVMMVVTGGGSLLLLLVSIFMLISI